MLLNFMAMDKVRLSKKPRSRMLGDLKSQKFVGSRIGWMELEQLLAMGAVAQARQAVRTDEMIVARCKACGGNSNDMREKTCQSCLLPTMRLANITQAEKELRGELGHFNLDVTHIE
jgi:ribosomal protein L37E